MSTMMIAAIAQRDLLLIPQKQQRRLGRRRRLSSLPTSAVLSALLVWLILLSFLQSISAQITFDIFPLKGDTFQFRYIFIIGGICGDDVDWYSKWAKAGEQTIQNITKVICANTTLGLYDDAYERQFHLDALEEVETLVGGRLHETLVITVGVNLEQDWTPVANLIKKGMAFFHAKEDEHNFNITDFGLTPETALYFYFQWDEKAAARSVGRELCRQYKGTQQLKIAKIYTDGRNQSQNYRVDDALALFRKECNETEIIELWEVYDDVVTNNDTKSIETLLRFNQIPDLLMASEDNQASFYLDIAKQVLPPNKYKRIATTGWDYIEDHRDLFKECKILTTVDQNSLYPNRGLWEVINSVVQLIEGNGLRTSKQVQDQLHLKDSLVIKSEATMMTCDTVGHLLNEIIAGSYDSMAPPSTEVEVSSGLYDVSITQMIPFEGKFEANFWLRLEWEDPRLEWDDFIYNGSLPIDHELIWTPAVYYNNQNDIETAELYQAPAMAESDGTVVLNTHSRIEFLCRTTSGLKAFPFDKYVCSIQLGAPYGVVLEPDGNFVITRKEPNFLTTQNITDQPPTQEEKQESEEGVEHMMGGETIVYYEMTFQRKAFTAWVRFIIPAVLINLVGFTSFWISEGAESVALGVTSLLCALAFRETVEIPETSDVTWTETFLAINIFYQALVVFIIFCSYGRFRGVAKTVDRLFKPLHPKRVKAKLKSSKLGRSSDNTGERIRLATEIPDKDQVDRGSSTRMFPPSTHHHLSLGSRISDFSHDTRDSRYSQSPANSYRLSTTFHNDTTHSQQQSRSSRASSRAGIQRGDQAVSIASFATGDTNSNRTSGQSFNRAFNLNYTEKDEETGAANISVIEEEDTMESTFNMGDPKQLKAVKKSYNDSTKIDASSFDRDGEKVNVDWIGRIFVVPSYIIVVSSLIATKWGLTS